MQKDKTAGLQKLGWGMVMGVVLLTAGGCATAGTPKASAPAEVVQPAVRAVSVVPPNTLPATIATIKKRHPDNIIVYATGRVTGEWVGFTKRFYFQDWVEFLAESANRYTNGDFGAGSKDRRIGYYRSDKVRQTIVLFMDGDDLRADLKDAYEADHAGK